MFRHVGWREIRLDIDPDVNPDVVASITDMQVISDAAVDAVYSSHNVEHLYPHEVPLALREMNPCVKAERFRIYQAAGSAGGGAIYRRRQAGRSTCISHQWVRSHRSTFYMVIGQRWRAAIHLWPITPVLPGPRLQQPSLRQGSSQS